jgi:hypothetical protein
MKEEMLGLSAQKMVNLSSHFPATPKIDPRCFAKGLFSKLSSFDMVP